MEGDLITTDESNNQNSEKYFQDILDINEFEGLKSLVENSNEKISWDELGKEGVVKIQGDKVEGIYWYGSLDLEETSIITLRKIKTISGFLICPNTIENLGELEEVGNKLEISNAAIKSLGKLKIVHGFLNCKHLFNLIDLGNLKEVKGSITIYQCPSLKSLGTLEKAGSTLKCDNCYNLESLGALKEVIGGVVLEKTIIKSLGKLKKIGGYLMCNYLKTLEDLGELEEVGGQMEIKGTSLKSLGNLKRVKYNFYCNNIETLEDLGDLEYVYGYLALQGTKIKSLGNLKKVYGSLFCSGLKTLEDLGTLREVTSTLNLSGTNVKSLGILEIVRASLICDNMKKLEDLGKLKVVNGVLDIKGINIDLQIEILKKYQNNLLKIGRTIIWGGNIEGIEKLLEKETIPGDLYLESKEIENLGKVHEVMGNLYMMKTSIDLQVQTLYNIEKGRININNIAVDDGRDKIVKQTFQNKEFSFLKFKKVFGENLNKLEGSNYLLAVTLLRIEYNEINEMVKKEGKRIIAENEGKNHGEDKKREIRKELKALGNKINEIKENIRDLGLIM